MDISPKQAADVDSRTLLAAEDVRKFWWTWAALTAGEFLLFGFSSEVVGFIGILVLVTWQWWVLRHRIRNAWWWLVLTLLFGPVGSVIGGVGGGWIQDAIDGVRSSQLGIAPLSFPGATVPGMLAATAFAGAALGLAVGFGQWLLLQSATARAHWWILVSTMAWSGTMISPLP